jgi:hypothetical protein
MFTSPGIVPLCGIRAFFMPTMRFKIPPKSKNVRLNVAGFLSWKIYFARA